MSGDVHARFWESPGVRFPRATQQQGMTEAPLCHQQMSFVIPIPVTRKIDRATIMWRYSIRSDAGAGPVSASR